MKPLKCIVVNDEPKAIKEIELYVNDYKQLKLLELLMML